MSSRKPTMPAHAPVISAVVPGSTHFNKSYSAAFCCAICGAEQHRNLNFLGGKTPVCVGEKFVLMSIHSTEYKELARAQKGGH